MTHVPVAAEKNISNVTAKKPDEYKKSPQNCRDFFCKGNSKSFYPNKPDSPRSILPGHFNQVNAIL